jgi:DNA-binding NtrC family response regulator
MPSPSKSEGQQTSILVLEDEEVLADIYTVWLPDEYNVRTAYTASEARKKFDEDVDIAFVDRRLPEESGDEVLDWISQYHPQCRRAMVSAVHPGVEIVEMPLDDYLVKPVERGEIVETVRQFENQRNHDEGVRDLDALTAKRAHLESELSEAERSNSEEFARLESEIENLEQDAAEGNVGFDGGA